MLLEVFRIELANRFKLLQSAFPSNPITYRNFHRFVKGNYPSVTETEVGELWRETNMVNGKNEALFLLFFQLSNGHFTIQAFWTAASVQFLKLIQLPSFFQNFKVDENNIITFDEQNFSVLQYIQKIDELKDEQKEDLKQQIILTGSEELLQSWKLLDKRNIQKENVYSICCKISSMIIRTHFQIIQMKGIDEQGLITQSLDTKFIYEYMQQILQESSIQAKEQKTLERLKERKIIRFQKLARKKVVKLYLLIASMLSGKKAPLPQIK